MTAGKDRTALVVMGVAGGGKTSIAQALAEQLCGPAAEADDLHPTQNIAKMSAGTPLDDQDRIPSQLATLAGLRPTRTGWCRRRRPCGRDRHATLHRFTRKTPRKVTP